MHKFADALGLHKSATFNATVTIHELTQVPLLHGKFRVKWKFKSATSSSHAGAELSPATSSDNLADGGPSSSSSSQHHAHHHFRFGQGRASRWLHPKSALSNSVSANGLSSSASSSTAKLSASRHRSPSGRSQERSSSSDEDDDNDHDDHETETAPNSPPLQHGGGGQALSPITPLSGPGGGDPGRTPNPNRTPGPSYANAFGNSLGERNVEALCAPTGASSDSPNGPAHPGMRRRGLSEASAATSPVSPVATPRTSASGPEPRGKTAAVGLRAHTATFNREISCPVSISLRHAAGDSKSYHLQPSPLRLTVRQQHMGEEHKLEEEKLGEVVLDLSQFVPRHGRRTEQGKPRRYLLQGCKSNTVLRISVKMEWLDGAHDYVVPPLKSGQISSSSHSGLKGLASLHGSPANRSTSSLAKGSQNSASSARLSTSNASNASRAMSRTNSASSQLSSRSAARSTPSPERIRQTRSRRPKGKGWHPPHSALTSATIPMITGTCGTGHTSDQRTAEEIIEMLFNRPASAMGGRGSWRDPKLANDERLGEPFQYRPTVPREPSAQTETSATSRGGRFSRARKAWSIRSGKSGKATPKEPAEFDRDAPEVPSAASYAQVEAPAEQRRQKERGSLLKDRTHDFTVRPDAHRQGSTDSAASLGSQSSRRQNGGTDTWPPAVSSKPKLAVRTATPLRRSESSSTETEHTHVGLRLGPPISDTLRRPSLPSSASSRPVSIRWDDQDEEREIRRRPSAASLTTTGRPKSILGLGLDNGSDLKQAHAVSMPIDIAPPLAFVTPPSPAEVG